MRPAIELKVYEINKIIYKKIGEFEEGQEDKSDKEDIKTVVESGVAESDESKGRISIEMGIIDKEGERSIDAKVTGYFTINKDVIEEQGLDLKDTLSINGAAILFPYIRSVISMVTSLDSDNAILLPTVNVMEFLDKE
ncbi:hypothetical protein [Brochothrix thermosphacta]|uniref:hypothetical protein n=1 Tax=Brochothrix thermosphacta TaxID=2756 RepID=UPI0039B06E33